MAVKLLVFVLIVKLVSAHLHLDWETKRPAFDPSVYEDALDPELCRSQLSHIQRLSNALLRLRFLEAGLRAPRSILEGNTLDMGNYRQCLEINEEIEDSVIEGKYCMINGPINENFMNFIGNLDSSFDPNVHLNNETWSRFEEYVEKRSKIPFTGLGLSRSFPGNPLSGTTFSLAVCIPKTCTTQEGIRGLLFNISAVGFPYEEQFCRFNNDKPWVPSDYLAIVVFSVIGLLTLMSTCYDLWHSLIAKKDPKTANTICRSFSVYTNSRRLTTFTANPNALQCVDGIRSLAMLWVIAGHSYQLLPPSINGIYVLNWLLNDLRSLWITAAPFTVDTFFFLTGILVVYTTTGKMSGMKLLKNLHFFYLSRILRMFPLLAAVVLLQASVFNRIADGPLWEYVADNTNRCRNYWWSTLLYLQNFFNPTNDCINHAWYLAIDMHLHIVSPLVLFWVVGGKRKPAWIGLTAGLLVSLTICTAYSFIYQFPGWSVAFGRPGGADLVDYYYYYYFNTLTRAPPFFVGMIFGYILHLWRGRKLEMPVTLAVFLWVGAIAMLLSLMYITHLMKDAQNWTYYTIDDLMNSFSRSLWALALGWIIFACHNGYGGPVNWFLSLNIWKLPSRISYAMYLFSYQIQYVINGTALTPIIFSDAYALYELAAQVVVHFVVAFMMTVLIDSPFSILFKLIMGDVKLLKNLHFFYLSRILRMFPLLAAVVLLQASVFNRIADGPLWEYVADNTNRCRNYWWSTLLYLQNFFNPTNDCINHAWYLAIDMHLHIVSPLVLFWVVGGKRKPAWIGLTAGLLVSLTICTAYSFIYQFPGWSVAFGRPGGADLMDYYYYYYFNTLTRAPPFFVGMIFGYILHLWRGRKLEMPVTLAVFLWVGAIAMLLSLMYITHLMKDAQNWTYYTIDDLMNSFSRSLWALALGWIIFACHNGYGGPVNWFLSLNIWKLPSRISYAMYLFSYQIQYVINGTALTPIIFSDAYALYELAAQVVVHFVVAFMMTVLIDSPFSILFKLIMGDGPKKPKKEVTDKE